MPSNFARYPSLDGTPVVISGGASGIGETIVREFAAQGSKVGFVDIAGEAGEALAAELVAAGYTARFTRCDITDTAAYQSAIRGLIDVGAGDAISAFVRTGIERADIIQFVARVERHDALIITQRTHGAQIN